MKLYRIQSNQPNAKPCYAMRQGGKFQPVQNVWEKDFSAAGEPIEEAEAVILAPSAPGKVVCVGLNYHAHVQEMGHEEHPDPVIFLKPSTAVIGANETIRAPKWLTRVDFEAEVAIVMGKCCKDVKAEHAQDMVLGYTALNDVTARDIQKTDGQWTRAKGFDTFCPMGPSIETEFDWRDAGVRCLLNGRVMQEGRTSSMMHDMNAIIAFISSVMTLEAGDVIATGTPSGIGPMQDGDRVVVEIEGLDTLCNTVKTI